MSTNGDFRDQIEEIDRREADAMLRADLSTLESIWDDNLIAYSTATLYARKQVLLDYMKRGGLRLKSHIRRTLEVVLDDDRAVSIGTENSEMAGAGAGTLMLCSYMNVWARRRDGWKLLARHVGRVSRSPVDPAPRK